MKRSGFTLIEILVALSLAAIVFLAGFMLLSSYLKTYKILSADIERLQIRQFVLTRIVKEVRSADSIKNSTPACLTIKNGTSVISYELIGGKVRRKKDSTSAYLTEAGQVNKLAFSYPGAGLVMIEVDDSKTGAFCRNEK
ncbi:MAG: prepilin-type N-terminal cleavage/methylation domain-containing protein [Candidatus Margulisiibacteriota bacterium]